MQLISVSPHEAEKHDPIAIADYESNAMKNWNDCIHSLDRTRIQSGVRDQIELCGQMGCDQMDHFWPARRAAMLSLTLSAASRTMSPGAIPYRLVIEPSECPTSAAMTWSP